MGKDTTRLTKQQKVDLAVEIAEKIEVEAENEKFEILYLVSALIFGPDVTLTVNL